MKFLKLYTKSIKLWSTALLLGLFLATPLVSVLAQSEYDEAIQQTEDQWEAVRNTMKQSKEKVDEFKKIYKEYHDAIFGGSPEEGIEFARKLFKLDKGQTDLAKKKVESLKEMFRTLDKNGLMDKLQSASDKLDFANSVAGEVQNIWEFTKKFDPANAKDNPTYGLRLIGTFLTEGASKMEKIPLVGQILGKWIGAYGEIAGDFAHALDKLGKKIEESRGGSLCGQLGYKTDLQKAFVAASKANEDCLTFFPTGIFPHMKGETYEGNNSYFLFDPSSNRGYFVSPSDADKVYKWHGKLIDGKALYPDWLASRANSLKPAVEQKARKWYTFFSGWANKTSSGWRIIEKLNLYQDAYTYGILDEEGFVGNYIIAEKHHDKINKIMEEFEKHLFIAGTVTQMEGDNEQPSQGATVEFTVNGKVYSETTSGSGAYEIVMEGKLNDAVQDKVSKEGFKTINADGRFVQNAIVGQNYTLYKDDMTVVISGTVFIKENENDPAVAASGATVSASASESYSLGSTTSGSDGSFTLTVKTLEGVEVTCPASKEDAAGAASFTVVGEAHTGLDITMQKADAEEEDTEGKSWIINVLVHDDAGNPLSAATVSSSIDAAAVTTGGDGSATIGPIEIPATWPEEAFAVTVTPTVTVVGGTQVGGSSATLTYDGESPSAVSLTIPVLIPHMVTISGQVTDANGIGVSGAVVNGGGMSATTTGGAFSIGPISMHKDSSVAVTAVLDDGANVYSGGPVTCTFDGSNTSISVTILLAMETETEVTITGMVKDLNSKPLPGAAVTGGGGATTTDGSGMYTLPPFMHLLGTPVIISASITAVDGVAVGGQAEAVPTSESASASPIIIDVEQHDMLEVTISGTVTSSDGDAINGAAVSGGGQSTTSDASGNFTLGLIEYEEGQSVAISASAVNADGESVGGSASVMPTSEIANVAIAIDMQSDTEDELDDLINEIENELDSLGVDADALLAEFNMMIIELDAIAGSFQTQADYIAQRIREQQQDVCSNSDASYALSAAGTQLDYYDFALSSLPGIYAELNIAYATDPSINIGIVDAEFGRVVSQGEALEGQYAEVLGAYNAYECDEDAADIDAGNVADENIDPDDIESGAGEGGGVEICEDGIDNDRDGEIDECDAGCCDKNVQITVSDCGNAADDVFLISINGADVGVTPKGAANTFNIELSPGTHSIRVTCLDDGGNPLGSDIGTACVSVVVFGTDAGIGGGEMSISYGGSGTISFNVPEGPAMTTVPQVFNGTTLRSLE